MNDSEPSSLGESPEERRLLIRALAVFSDACDLPELTPECPYYEYSEQGPVCAEQCRDLIAANADTLKPTSAFSLGFGLEAIRRRRPRHGPGVDDRAFDAAQIRLEDADKPVGQRRLTSLVSELATHILVIPDASGLAACAEVIEELERRQIDVDTMTRSAMAWTVWTSVALLLLGAQVDSPEDRRDGWRLLLDSVVPPPAGAEDPDDSLPMRINDRRFIYGVAAWVAASPLDELLSKEPPAFLDVDPSDDFVPPRASPDIHWLIDRFSKTFLHDWKYDSLLYEWEYLHALRPGCASAAAMRERRIDKAELAAAVANESVEMRDSEDMRRKDGRPGDGLSLSSCATFAIEALTEGRRGDAIALYSGVQRLLVDDPEVRNNLGFCMLIDDPHAAVAHFMAAVDGDDHEQRENALTNLAFALRSIGDHEGAAEAVATALEEIDDERSVYMWAIDGSTDLLQAGLREYALELQAAIESELNAASGAPTAVES